MLEERRTKREGKGKTVRRREKKKKTIKAEEYVRDELRRGTRRREMKGK